MRINVDVDRRDRFRPGQRRGRRHARRFAARAHASCSPARWRCARAGVRVRARRSCSRWAGFIRASRRRPICRSCTASRSRSRRATIRGSPARHTLRSRRTPCSSAPARSFTPPPIGFSIEGDIGYDVLIEIAAAALHRRLRCQGAAEARLEQPVLGVGRGRARRTAAAARERQGVVLDLLVRLLGALRQDAGRRREAAAAGGRRSARAAQAGAGAIRRAGACRRAGSHGVALRKLAAGDDRSSSIRSGTLVVKQQIVPLNTARDIDLYGGAPVSGARRFHLDAALQGQGQHVDAGTRTLLAGAVLRDERRREARRAVVRGDGLRHHVRRRRRELRRSRARRRCVYDSIVH